MQALRWALESVHFQVLLKVDDDSIVHIGRLWAWIYHELPKEDPNAPPPTQLYAGRVFRDSQVCDAGSEKLPSLPLPPRTHVPTPCCLLRCARSFAQTSRGPICAGRAGSPPPS